MKKVNTTYWKEFALNSLFDIILSKGDIQAKRMKDGDIPLISSGKFNNGICAYIAEGDGKAEIFEGNVITTDMFGKSYYQDKPFYAVSHGRVNILLPLFKMNHYIAKYIVSILDSSFLTRYSFSGMCSQSQLKKEKILLPATPAGEPAWQFMEDYMRRIEQRTKTAISAFVSSKYASRKIDTTYWREYIIENLFDKLDLRFKPKKFVKSKHVSIERTEEFNIPLVNAKHSNNGIMYYGRESDFESEEMTIDIVADGAASTGDVYPQPQRTGVLYNAYLIKLKNRNSSKAVLCFLSTIIERCVKQKYGYDNKCTWDKVKKEKILLPATPAGEPDWRYMEMFMRGVEAITKEKISLLTKKKQEPIQQTNLVNYGTVNIYEK